MRCCLSRTATGSATDSAICCHKPGTSNSPFAAPARSFAACTDDSDLSRPFPGNLELDIQYTLFPMDLPAAATASGEWTTAGAPHQAERMPRLALTWRTNTRRPPGARHREFPRRHRRPLSPLGHERRCWQPGRQDVDAVARGRKSCPCWPRILRASSRSSIPNRAGANHNRSRAEAITPSFCAVDLSHPGLSGCQRSKTRKEHNG